MKQALKKIAQGSNLISIVLTALIAGCDGGNVSVEPIKTDIGSAEVANFKRAVENNLIFIEGGRFSMGDFGEKHARNKENYDGRAHTKPLHEVELSGYSISQFKITNSDYQFYLKAQGLTLRQDVVDQDYFNAISLPPKNPAHLDWYEADKYCTWLGALTGLDVALPTEAQWEYAARSGGQLFPAATEDGFIWTEPGPVVEGGPDTVKGINVSTVWDRLDFAKQMGWKPNAYTPLPVDQFPPNALGIYSMTDNGMEWVKDWYGYDYYKSSPTKDPQGPEEPTYKSASTHGQFAKVLRGAVLVDDIKGAGLTIYRDYENPAAAIRGSDGDLIVINDKTARCVVNSPNPIKN